MLRRPRLEVGGGVQHVYAGVASDNELFAEPEVAIYFIGRASGSHSVMSLSGIGQAPSRLRNRAPHSSGRLNPLLNDLFRI